MAITPARREVEEAEGRGGGKGREEDEAEGEARQGVQITRAEGKPRPTTPESTDEEEEEASDAEGHLLGDNGSAAGASSPPAYQWDDDEGAPAAPEETRTAAESSADPSLEGAERELSPPAAGVETPVPQVLIRGDESAAGAELSVLAASRHQADTRGAPSGQSSRGGAVPQARRSATRKRSMSARSG